LSGIRKIFSQVPDTYEVINHVLTMGLDVLWRKRTAMIASRGGGTRWLDVCSGTGEMAVYLRRFAEPETSIFATDFCKPMLDRARAKPEAAGIQFALGDTRALPFEDNSFDLVTISFATRNINVAREHLEDCLREFCRILKPGGRFINLETSQPPVGLIRAMVHFYVRTFVAPIGAAISRSRAGYSYLSRTIPRFYAADEYAEIIRASGFSEVSFRRMGLGIVAVHEAIK
jgi:demethylmenaquinone methyltransferase/2-methoxy-6-polyprenyl-1,4-benzoquinol methylase